MGLFDKGHAFEMLIDVVDDLVSSLSDDDDYAADLGDLLESLENVMKQGPAVGTVEGLRKVGLQPFAEPRGKNDGGGRG